MKKLAALAAVALLVAGFALLSPYRGFEGDTYVEIPRGTGAVGIAQALADEGVIRYPWQFWLMRALRPSARLQAGEYRFAEAASVREVFDRMARGDIYYLEFTVPEGSNIFDIARSLEAQRLMTAEDFLSAATDPSSISDLAPEAKTLEGYLFPSTYRLSHHTTAAQLCKRMTDEFRRQWNRLAAGQTAEAHRTVTLASLVEKETGVAQERPLIAGVFTNRLEKGMRLECDPTTIYAALLENRYRGAIHRSDLARANPYNTYQNAGLPPGPIANPGAQALAAALHPAETDYLYFVANPSGDSHHFSASMAEHEKAVVAYRNASHKRKTN